PLGWWLSPRTVWSTSSAPTPSPTRPPSKRRSTICLRKPGLEFGDGRSRDPAPAHRLFRLWTRQLGNGLSLALWWEVPSYVGGTSHRHSPAKCLDGLGQFSTTAPLLVRGRLLP